MKKTKDYINLLPGEAKRPAKDAAGKGAYAVVLVALVFIGFYAWQVKQAWDLKKRLAETASRRQAVAQELDALKKDLGIAGTGQTAVQNAAVVNTILGERVLWSEVFRQFSLIVPRGMWFDNLEGMAGDRSEIRIKGGAFSYLAVAEFMSSMDKTGYFERPQLIYAQKSAAAGADVIAFEIVCGIRKKGPVLRQ